MQVPLPKIGRSTQGSAQYDEVARVDPVQDARPQQVARLGQSIQEAGSAMTAIDIQMNEDHALAVTKQGVNQMNEFADSVEREFEDRLGADIAYENGRLVKAGEPSDKAAEKVEDRVRRIENGMTSELAKRMFRQHAGQNMVDIRNRMKNHEAKQLKAFNHGQNVALLTRHADNYIQGGTDRDRRVALYYAGEISTDLGHSPEERDAFLLDTATQMSIGVVDKLLEDDPSEADTFLRSLSDKDISRKARSTQRKRIDEAVRVKGDSRWVDKEFENDGYSGKEERRRALDAGAVAKGLDSGEISEGDLAYLPGVDPKAKGSTLALDILNSRNPGAPRADRGPTVMRMLDNADKDLRAGRITPEQNLRRKQSIIERAQTQVDAEAGADIRLLGRAKEALAGGLSPMTPEFQSAHPELYAALESRGLLAQAVQMGMAPAQRGSAEGYFEASQTENFTGMSIVAFEAKYRGNLSETEFNSAYLRWSSANGNDDAQGRIKKNPILKHDVSMRYALKRFGILSGEDNQGNPAFDGEDEKEDYRDFLSDLDYEIRRSGGEWDVDRIDAFAQKWATNTIDVLKDRGGAYGMVRSDKDVERLMQLQGDIRRAKQQGNEVEVKRLTGILDRQTFVFNGKRYTANRVGRVAFPVKVSQHIYDTYRVKRLEEVDPRGAALVKKELGFDEESGGFTTEDRNKIEEAFTEYGVEMERPSPIEQAQMWEQMQTTERWKKFAEKPKRKPYMGPLIEALHPEAAYSNDWSSYPRSAIRGPRSDPRKRK